MYTESHPRRIAAHAASSISSNSFASYSFRTLASHFQTCVSSNSFAIKRFRTLCKIPGIGYPPSLNFIFHSSAQTALQERTNCALFSNNSFACHTSTFDGGRGYESIEPCPESAVGLPDGAVAGSMRALRRRREEPGRADLDSGQGIGNGESGVQEGPNEYGAKIKSPRRKSCT